MRGRKNMQNKIKLRLLIVMLRTLAIKTNKNWDFNNQAKNLVKNGTGSRFGRKIGRDGGIEKKKRRESGI